MISTQLSKRRLPGRSTTSNLWKLEEQNESCMTTLRMGKLGSDWILLNKGYKNCDRISLKPRMNNLMSCGIGSGTDVPGNSLSITRIIDGRQR